MSNWITSVEAWFKKVFLATKTNFDTVAIAITQDLQNALNSGVVDVIAKFVEGTFPSVQKLPEAIVAELKLIIPKILVAELALQGLPDNPTQEEVQAFAESVAKAFNVNQSNSKLWTVFGAQVYGILLNDKTKTFASLVLDVEQAYQALQADLADQSN
jgi:hypothetical protein